MCEKWKQPQFQPRSSSELHENDVYIASFLFSSFWPYCQMCTCVPTIIILYTLFNVSCSDSNRNVASKQSVFKSLMRARDDFKSIRIFLLVLCCTLRYARLFYLFAWIVFEVIFLARVPCFLLCIYQYRYIPSAFYSNE